MPRKMLRRHLGRLRDVVHQDSLRAVFGELLHAPGLWHLNRGSVSLAVSVGLFVAWVPIPSQMVLAAAVAIAVGCNLPIAVAMVWISNPVTMAPLFFAAYKLGAWLLDEQPGAFEFELSFAWLAERLVEIWQPFLLGCLVLGISCALIGNITVRIIWRVHVIASWNERRRRRMRQPAD